MTLSCKKAPILSGQTTSSPEHVLDEGDVPVPPELEDGHLEH